MVFIRNVADGLFLKLTGPLCDGRTLSSLLFLRHLKGRGAFFPRSAVSMGPIRSVAMHESSSCSREDSPGDCDGPCDRQKCCLFSALWLRCSQLLCRRLRQQKISISHFYDTHASQYDPCPWIGLFTLLGRSDCVGPLLPPDFTSNEQQRGSFSSFCTLSLETGYSSNTTANITTT